MKLEEKECSFFHNYIKGAHKGVPFKEGGKKKEKKYQLVPLKLNKRKNPNKRKTK